MPKDKTETHERIIPAAMKIFLEKGFEKATMREIAEEAGITAAGLYRHFVDKEAMFAALVEPVLSELQKWCERTREKAPAGVHSTFGSTRPGRQPAPRKRCPQPMPRRWRGLLRRGCWS